jgi:anthranilate synthase component 1
MRDTLENAAVALDALRSGLPALVCRRLIADTETPVGAALKLMREGRGDFLLRSVEGGEVRGRYSLLGLAPDLVFRAKGAKAEINRHWATDPEAFEPLERDSLAELRALVTACHIDVPAGLPPVLACLVGYFGYETIGLVEKLPRAPDSRSNCPTCCSCGRRSSGVRPPERRTRGPGADLAFGNRPEAPRLPPSASTRLSRAQRPLPADPRLAEPIELARQPVMAPGAYADMVTREGLYRSGRHLSGGDRAALHDALPAPASALYRSLRRINRRSCSSSTSPALP